MSRHTVGPIYVDEEEGKFFLTADLSALRGVKAVGVVYEREDAVLFSKAWMMLSTLEQCLLVLQSSGPVIGGNSGADVRGSLVEMISTTVEKAKGSKD